jgi:hypothetical protein
MTIEPRTVGRAIIALVVLVMLLNTPGVDDALRGWLGESAFPTGATAVAVVVLALALLIWFSAIAHLRANASLEGRRRSWWYAITYGAFVFGAIAYYLRFMRPKA